jgi:hypothetical protein
MKLCIIDSAYPLGSTTLGIGAQWAKWHLRRKGVALVGIRDASVALVSCVSTSCVSFLRSLRRRYKHLKVIVGGAGALSPYSIGEYADA